MDIVHSRGIVLSSSSYGESDVQCIVYTRDSGKKRLVFKGLRKSNKRPRTASEPGALIDFTYYYHPAKNSHTASDFTCLDNAPHIRNDYLRICVMLFILEITDKTTPYDDSSVQLFDLLEAAIKILAETEYPIHLAAVYCLHCLKIHGLQPEFSLCRMCGRKMSDSFVLHPADLQPVCIFCSGKSGRELPSSLRDFLVQALTRKFRTIEHALYPVDNIKDFLYYAILYIEDHYSVGIHSGRFILEGNVKSRDQQLSPSGTRDMPALHKDEPV